MRIPGRKALDYSIRLVRSRFVRHGLILGYHRVSTHTWDPFRLCVSPENFAQHLEILHDHANVISLAELVEARAAGDIAPRSVAITFDDGYSDYLSAVQPMLSQAGFPGTIFISTGYIGREFWWDTLARLVGSLDCGSPLTVVADGPKFEWRPQSRSGSHDRNALLHGLYGFLLPLDAGTRSNCLNQIADLPGYLRTAESGTLAMSAQEIRRLAAYDSTEIGCHTVSHPMLARLPEEQQRSEIVNSKQALEKLTGHPVNGFSFPNGSKSPSSVRLVEECGFTYACASHKDVVWRNSDPYCLPRLWMPDCDGTAFHDFIGRWL